MRQLYQAIAVPSFTYAADIWFTPVFRGVDSGMSSRSIGVAHKLSTIQRMATTAITGVLHTSASDVMEAHANLLPIELTMDRVCHQATLCLVALPESHPLFKPVRQSARRLLKRHRSPLHHLFHAFNVRPQDCRTIMPPTPPPNEVSALQLQIADTREESREEDEGDKADMRVYSDGSGIEGMAGAAAVLFHDSQESGRSGINWAPSHAIPHMRQKW